MRSPRKLVSTPAEEYGSNGINELDIEKEDKQAKKMKNQFPSYMVFGLPSEGATYVKVGSPYFK